MEVCEPPTAVTELIDTIIDNSKIYNSELGIDDNSLLGYLTSIKHEIDFNSMIETFNTCYCCERHQKDKPKKLEKYIETTFKNGGNIKYPCNCKCRQFARFLCRTEYGFCYKSE